MKKKHKLSIITSLFVCILSFSVNAQQIYDLYPDSHTVREEIVSTWFSEPISVIRDKSSEILQTNIGDYFLVRAEEYNGLMEIIVSPLVIQTFNIVEYDELVTSEKSTHKNDVKIETWPKDALGSWILYRDVVTGIPVKIRQYIMPDSEIYIEFYPGSKTSATFSLYGGLVAYQVPVSLDFESLYTASIKEVKTATKHFPWEYAEVYNKIYSDITVMISTIRDSLPKIGNKISDADDSEFVFLKWIIDGLVSPLIGGDLFLDSLENQTIEQDLSYPTRANAYLSLNYVRNLATACLSAETGINYTPATSNVDVDIKPFAFFVEDNGAKKRVQYLNDNGYETQLLKSVLYVLATTEPQLFYLGAVRESEKIEITNKKFEQFSYNHAVVFFPWFDSKGRFSITVFQDGKELTFDQFSEKYENCFIHLVRVKSSMNFFPEVSEND